MNFDEIYKKYASLVYTLAVKYAQNIEDAEEITQDVFLQVYEKYHEFRHEAKLETWLFRITVNKSIDFLRSKKRQKNVVHRGTSELPISLSSEHSDPVQVMLSNEGIKYLLNCIYQLPENQQKVIILMKFEQKSTKETAQILQITPKAAESLLQRAKSSLKKLWLNERDYE